jgi:hypothetical protein
MRQLVFLSIVCIVLTGCGGKTSSKGAVAGTIKYKDKPVNGCTLTLNPVGDTKSGAIFVPVGQDGTFRTLDVPPGEYKITVEGSTGSSGLPPTGNLKEKMKEQIEAMKTAPTIPFPDKYKQVASSTLTLKVEPGENKQDLVLTD